MIRELAETNFYENWLTLLTKWTLDSFADHQGIPSLSILFEVKLLHLRLHKAILYKCSEFSLNSNSWFQGRVLIEC